MFQPLLLFHIATATPRPPQGFGGHLPEGKGLLRHQDLFDNLFFKMSGIQAQKTDPQLRFLLELSYEALVDAGIDITKIRGSNAGVYVGSCFTDCHKGILCRTVHAMNETSKSAVKHSIVIQSPSSHSFALPKKFRLADRLRCDHRIREHGLRAVDVREPALLLLRLPRSLHEHRHRMLFLSRRARPSLPGTQSKVAPTTGTQNRD